MTCGRGSPPRPSNRRSAPCSPRRRRADLSVACRYLFEMGDEVLPIGALLFLAEVVDRPAVVETMRHVVPVGGDHRVLDLGEVVEDLEIETAARAQLVLVQNVEHAPEADAVAVIQD